MLKKSKKTPIVGVPEEAHIVEKSRPLMLMKEVPFALGELKVLDTYLARINARDPEATTVRFSKEEYEELMGVERMHPERLDKYVLSLQSKIVKVPDSTARNGWRNYNLFDESAFEQDENGRWWIDLSCTSKAKSLFFNIDGVGYIRYQLRNVLPLSSKYSVLLYVYLLDNRFRVNWEVSVETLREEVLRCTDPLYSEFKYLNQRILKKCIKEINEKTDLSFEYEPVKIGRKVARIKWQLIKDSTAAPSLPESTAMNIDPDQMTIYDFDDPEENYSGSYFVELARVVKFQFDQVELEVLNSLLTERRPSGSTEEYCNDLKIAYSSLQVAKTKEKIYSDFAYIKGIIRKLPPLKKVERSTPQYSSESSHKMTAEETEVLEQRMQQIAQLEEGER